MCVFVARFEEKPYEIMVEWQIPEEDTKKIEIILDNFENARIRGTAAFSLESPEKEVLEAYKLKADLHNQSPHDEVNLALFTEIATTHPEWE